MANKKNPNIKNKIVNKNNLVNIVSAALMYFGVPPKLAPIIANIIVTFLAWAIVMVPLFVLAIILVIFSGNTSMSKNYDSLDPYIKSVTSQISQRYGIPESVLVGLAKHQTNFGSTSPYDSLEHSLSTEGIVTPSIGSNEDLDQGLGVYLIASGFIKNNPEYELNPQSFSDETELVASLIKDKMDYFSSQGISPPTSASTSDAYWAEILNSLPIADPNFTKWTCSSTSGTLTRKIADIWGCEFKKNGARIYYQDPTNPAQLSLLQTSDSIPVVVDDALNFAWNFNKTKNSSLTNWESISLTECTRGSGIFPISNFVQSNKKLDLCNADINIDQAAKIFISNLKRDNTAEGPYSKLYSGWSYFNSQVGVSTKEGSITGPFISNIPEPCFNITNSFITSYVSNLTESSSLLQDLLKTEQGPLSTEFCKDITPNDIIFIASTKILEYSNSETNNNPYLEKVINEITSYADSNFNPNTKRGFIPRLAVQPIVSKLPFDNSIPEVDSSLGYRIIGDALYFGGLFPGDERAGTNPYEGIGSTFSQGALLLSLDRIDPLKEQNVSTQTDERLSVLTCSTQTQKDFALTQYQMRWDRMCNDARQAGVNLFITSSWRSYEMQVDLARKYEGESRAAKPGYSPHEKGSAVDVYLGSRDGLEGDSKKEYAWLHSIVGCYNKQTSTYRQLPIAILPSSYSENLNSGGVTCAGNEIPIKRMQTYGLTPLCLNHYSSLEKFSDADVILCKYEPMKGSSSGQKREAWHMDLGKVENVSESGKAVSDCSSIKLDLTSDQTVAVSIKNIWFCNLSNLGYDRTPVDGNGAYISNLQSANLAEQVSSEAVLVAYCSTKLNTQFSKFNRKGIFALRSNSNYNASLNGRQNIDSAIQLWLENYNQHKFYHGWEDFLYIDASTYNDSKLSRFSILGRFTSQAPYPTVGEYNGNIIPLWAADPENNFAGVDCKNFYAGNGN